MIKFHFLAILILCLLAFTSCNRKNNGEAKLPEGISEDMKIAADGENSAGSNIAAFTQEEFLTEADTIKTYDYNKILNGDLSEFAGNWTNKMNDHLSNRELRADGTFSDGQSAVVFNLTDRATYTWNIYTEDGGGFVAELYPVGVEVRNARGIVPSDTTKVRMHSGHEPPFESDQIYYLETAMFITLPNNTVVDSRISNSTVNIILKRLEAIENGDIAAFRTTLPEIEDGASMYQNLSLIFNYFEDFFDVDADGFRYAVSEAEGLEPIIHTAFSRDFPLRSRNTGLFVKKMEIETRPDMNAFGYGKLVRVTVTNNKKEEEVFYFQD
jgi:hypothetical protein